VPADAVQRTQQGLFAYVLKADGTVEFRSVKIGPITQGLAVVENGVAEGERIVTAGQYRLQPGAKVQISTEQAPQTTATSDKAKSQNIVKD
jgi:multidrug efflux system membrane fusion protein